MAKDLEYRIRYLHIVTVAAAAILLIHLFDRSVVDHAKAKAQAQNQYLANQELLPRRGTIYIKTSPDGKGQLYPLATTKEKYQILVVPKNVKDHRKVADSLGEILDLDKEQIFTQINNQKLYVPPLARRQEKEVAEKVVKANLEGVLVAPELVRFYPEGPLASQLVGFVNFENKGNYGIEGFYDETLQGFSGKVVAERDSKGRFINVDRLNPARDGDDLILTVDQNVQFKAQELVEEGIGKYAADTGQLVVMEAKTGGILAMASTGGFDPNIFNEVKPDEQNRFLNPNIALIWEPGSVFKPIVVSAGIDSGKVKPEDEGVFGNFTVVQGYEIHTAQDKSFGKENITQCLENSDNVCLVWIGEKIGSETLHKYFTDYGFGVKTGIDLAGETTGSLLSFKKWRDIHRATMSFGQGISMTPIQLAGAYTAIANDGKMLAPHVVEKIVRKPAGAGGSDGSVAEIQPKEIRQVLTPETAATMRQMLISVVENGHGKRARVKGYKIGGKTGTAQVPKADGSGYEEDAHIGGFLGLVPGDNPRFIVFAKFDRPKNVEFAESSAAPTVGKMAEFLLNYYQIPPTEPVQ